ncbi:deoxyribodipyrimidine photo-lyase [Neptuniibacter pectenicola]|uniref:Deoxyribodipyrimidine photo-lyase n=1 Tax=Neptuniibacter pectenicola TaxID=1806669 RepID=A0ABU9TS85_9GAMM
MNTPITIAWFEQDLRLSDNPAFAAAAMKDHILPIYIFDNRNAGEYEMGGASRWWLHHSLTELNEKLDGKLNFFQGDPQSIIEALCSRFNVTDMFWNRRYEPWRISRDKKIKANGLMQGKNVQTFNASLLNEPWTILKKDGTPYKVFTPYYRQVALGGSDTQAQGMPRIFGTLNTDDKASTLDELPLLPKIGWDTQFYDCWSPGESGAQSVLQTFLANRLSNYKEGRDFPALKSISTLSPHLHFGEISPRQIHDAFLSLADDNNREHFLRELHWREFSYYLLFHWPDLPNKNLKVRFNLFPWQENSEALTHWQQGLTGYPLVDAGMRELWQTGFMHNRVRMITASFLVKNLLVDWRLGARWFWDCLVDADLASNSASWQWVAGCGTDASPYFRIFNPTTQGVRFDPEGLYTKHFIPELKDLPAKYLYRPWEAPPDVLKKANIILGETYPFPIVDIKVSREKALAAYRQL